MDAVRLVGAGGAVRTAEGCLKASHATAGRTPVYSRAGRTDRQVTRTRFVERFVEEGPALHCNGNAARKLNGKPRTRLAVAGH